MTSPFSTRRAVHSAAKPRIDFHRNPRRKIFSQRARRKKNYLSRLLPDNFCNNFRIRGRRIILEAGSLRQRSLSPHHTPRLHPRSKRHFHRQPTLRLLPISWSPTVFAARTTSKAVFLNRLFRCSANAMIFISSSFLHIIKSLLLLRAAIARVLEPQKHQFPQSCRELSPPVSSMREPRPSIRRG